MACSFSPPMYQLFAFASMQLELLTTCIFTVYLVTTFSLPVELLCKTLHFANLLSGRKCAFWKCGKELNSLISNQNSWCKHAFLYRFLYIFCTYLCKDLCTDFKQILYRFLTDFVQILLQRVLRQHICNLAVYEKKNERPTILIFGSHNC